MYNFIAMAVIGVGSAVAGAVWKAKQKDKKFLEQLKSLQPKEPAQAKEAVIIVETTNGKKQ